MADDDDPKERRYRIAVQTIRRPHKVGKPTCRAVAGPGPRNNVQPKGCVMRAIRWPKNPDVADEFDKRGRRTGYILLKGGRQQPNMRDRPDDPERAGREGWAGRWVHIIVMIGPGPAGQHRYRFRNDIAQDRTSVNEDVYRAMRAARNGDRDTPIRVRRHSAHDFARVNMPRRGEENVLGNDWRNAINEASGGRREIVRRDA